MTSIDLISKLAFSSYTVSTGQVCTAGRDEGSCNCGSRLAQEGRRRKPRGMRAVVTYLSDDPAEGERGVRTGEDVLVHADDQFLSSYPHVWKSRQSRISPPTAKKSHFVQQLNEKKLTKDPR